jgi:hypothetical protein
MVKAAMTLEPSDDKSHNPTRFQLNGSGAGFTCIPAQTSNFEVFCLCHPELYVEHETIWNYYRDLFIRAKLKNEHLTQFRINLQDMISEVRPTASKDVFGGGFHNPMSRVDEISDKIIKLSLWLELQYRVDTVVDKISENVTVDEMTNATASMLQDGRFPELYSYFMTAESDVQAQQGVDKTQKLFVKKVFEYTHKGKHNFICESEFGAVKINMDRYNPYVHKFSKELERGAAINVVGGRVQTNIDNSVPTLMISHWFID